jgi:hypothetical protein
MSEIITYDCAVKGRRGKYRLVSVVGEVINEPIGPFAAGELAVQARIKSIKPVAYHAGAFNVVHIETGANIGHAAETKIKAIKQAKARTENVAREEADKHINQVKAFMAALDRA